MSELTKKEFEEVTNTWINRLENAMSSAGCNDVCNDEFPQSVCDKFNDDGEVLNAWKKIFTQKTGIEITE
jgi:hypothetical protein